MCISCMFFNYLVVSASCPCIYDHVVCDNMVTFEEVVEDELERGVECARVDVSDSMGRCGVQFYLIRPKTEGSYELGGWQLICPK